MTQPGRRHLLAALAAPVWLCHPGVAGVTGHPRPGDCPAPGPALPASAPGRREGLMASLDEHANGTSLTLALGESVTLSLPENPTTGYRWRITEDGGPVLRQQADGFTPGGPALGAGGTHRWTWQAVQPGQAVLRLDYVRPWGTDPAARQFAVTIRVGG